MSGERFQFLILSEPRPPRWSRRSAKFYARSRLCHSPSISFLTLKIEIKRIVHLHSQSTPTTNATDSSNSCPAVSCKMQPKSLGGSLQCSKSLNPEPKCKMPALLGFAVKRPAGKGGGKAELRGFDLSSDGRFKMKPLGKKIKKSLVYFDGR